MRCGICGREVERFEATTTDTGVVLCESHWTLKPVVGILYTRECPHCGFLFSTHDATFTAYGSECPQCRQNILGDGPVTFTTAGTCGPCGGPQWVRFDGTCVSGGHHVDRSVRYTPPSA